VWPKATSNAHRASLAASGGMPGMSAAFGSDEETVAMSTGQRASVSAFGFAVTRRSAAPALVLRPLHLAPTALLTTRSRKEEEVTASSIIRNATPSFGPI